MANQTVPSLVLQNAQETHYLELMSWFSDLNSVRRWGGPHMRYPFTLETLYRDMRCDEWASYALLHTAANGSLVNAELAAFGQVVERLGRHHLGRLVVSPKQRGKGYGQWLIKHLLFAAQSQQRRAEASLLVYRDNLPAYHCYSSLGFVEAERPTSMPQQEGIVFMLLSLPESPAEILIPS